jgi:kinesin family protein 22
MQGVASSSKECGIIPRTIKALFLKQARMKRVKITVSMEYLEIYCDDCFDLLTEPPAGGKPRPKIVVLTNQDGKNIVHNLTRVVISSAQEFDAIYNNAAAYRSTASTKLNSQSSRSHAVLTIEVKTEEVAEGGKILIGRINLVDLAGRCVHLFFVRSLFSSPLTVVASLFLPQ